MEAQSKKNPCRTVLEEAIFHLGFEGWIRVCQAENAGFRRKNMDSLKYVEWISAAAAQWLD